MAKAILLALFAAAFVFAAAVFDAATGTRAAMGLNAAALEATPQARRAIALRAEQTLERRWSRPTRWHAGAVEALSWAKALQGDAAALAASAAAAERGLALAPVQPTAWTRLALLRRKGVANGLCQARACLDRSWTAAATSEPELQCARLGLAHALGDAPRANDPRVRAFIAAEPGRTMLARCLAFLPADERFRILLAAKR